ncbi:NADP-dependent oxidoreductase domain-containing protein [Glomus cerebriforme]|uniref:NADP-dependent oxidoreductase domain-containing protein n=1 Tax=Glomus cerebriforme TaxID=658196 RepID=A0A397STK3_9GLOM|nr:NADP-dependent oxidoreductase domain-containing protein [Glomus cerebriforme]
MFPNQAIKFPKHFVQFRKSFSILNYSSVPTSTIIKTGQIVSRLGFGGYRINWNDDRHNTALERAIKSGINVIDTSTHFEFGESEEVIGKVLNNAIKDGIVTREGVVIISKAGYVNITDTTHLNDSFAKINDKSAHSISPEFLNKQISESLSRLNLEKLDIFMLNNPERILQAKNKYISISNLYDEIERALNYLDEEVTKGRIGGYGINSNSMAISTASDHISLPKIFEKLSNPSKKNFVAIQTPFNLFERDLIQRGIGQTCSLAEYAKSNDIFIFTNRPLQSMAGGNIRKLVNNNERDSRDLFENQIIDNLTNGLQRLDQLESEFSNELFPSGHPLTTKFLWSQILSQNLSRLSQNHFAAKYYLEKQVKPAITKDLEFLCDYMKNTALDEEKGSRLQSWVMNYQMETQSLIDSIISYANINLLNSNDELDSIITYLAPSLYSETVQYHSPLSVKVLRINLANQIIGCVLVGMRKPEYVQDSLSALELSEDDYLTIEALDDIYASPILQ